MKRSKLKKRLRKKYHLGEFQELGFEIFTELKSGLNEKDFNRFVDDFIDEIERNKLLFGGGGGKESWKGFVSSSIKYTSPTEEQRENFRKWLANRSEIQNVKIDEFRDAWHNWD
ncbi:MAG TPA: 50S ribosome-binding protein YggL [Pyrinomonadaceae bacterium]|nr:50S ribosome-binding protein YggL [Pyrinomonadaceae bacterium]